MTRDMDLVLVEWVDSASSANPGWKPLDRAREDAWPVPCRSVGWLVRDDAEAVTLVPHLSGDDEVGVCGRGELGIPRCSIVTLKKLCTIPDSARNNAPYLSPLGIDA